MHCPSKQRIHSPAFRACLKQDEIIGPAFETEHPRNDAKREATKRYELDHGNLLIGVGACSVSLV